MPYSAPALGVGLRLRSRRVRSDRSPISTFRLALIAAALAALAGFLGSSIRDDSQPWLWFGPASATDGFSRAGATGLASANDGFPDAAAGVVRRADPALATVAFGTAAAFVGAGGRPGPVGLEPVILSAARPLAPDEQRYADDLWSIHTQLELTSARVGLGAAFYRSQEIDRGELRARLNQSLARYRQAALEVEALQPPPSLRATHAGYLAVVRLFEQSTLEMLRMYDDGDDEHLSTALPMRLDGTSRLREIGARFWPDSYPAV